MDDNISNINQTDKEKMLDKEEEVEKDKKKDKDESVTLSTIFDVLFKNWWILLLNCILIGVIAALFIIEVPRTYTTEVKLAPEAEDMNAGGSLSSIASSFGIDLGNMTSSDAIRPDLYPDLVESADFVTSLFKLPVKTIDGNIYTDYYTYLKKYQRAAWWQKEIKEFTKKFADKPKERKASANQEENYNKIKILSNDEELMIENIRGLVSCSVDQKTYVITITVTDQDPLVSATVADSVRAKIQNFITDYRTKKATKDYNYYYGLLLQAKKEYDQSCEKYARYVDAHRDVILQAYISERDQLENDMQLKLNTYNAMIVQVQNAKAKIQEHTPAFTILQNAFVPVKPTGPKRMLFVLGMVFLTFTITMMVLLRKSFTSQIKA